MITPDRPRLEIVIVPINPQEAEPAQRALSGAKEPDHPLNEAITALIADWLSKTETGAHVYIL